MRVLLVSANTEKINMPVLPLGLACVAEATRNAGHDVKLVDLMDQQNTRMVLKDAVDGFQPGVIGISVRNIDDQCMENPRESWGRPLYSFSAVAGDVVVRYIGIQLAAANNINSFYF